MEKDNQIIIYKAEDGKSFLEVKLTEETIWLTQKQMSKLFDKDKKTISRHISNICKEKELSRNRTVSFFETVQKEGKRTITRKLEYATISPFP